MPKASHIMCDIETLSTSIDAVVLSIGAVRFDLESGELDVARQWNLSDIDHQVSIGRKISIDTVKWWLKREAAAIDKTFFADNSVTTAEALDAFYNFCTENTTYMRDVYIWGNGNTFDNMIMRSLCVAYQKPYPCTYTNDLDLRTAKFITRSYGITQEKIGTAHNAMDDAITQARALIRMQKAIKLGTKPC